MAKAGDKKRAAAAALSGNEGDVQDSGGDAKRCGSGRAPSGDRKDLKNAPVQAANKAVVPQQAAAANASVIGEDKETSEDKLIGQYDSFELQIKRITQGKPSKTPPHLSCQSRQVQLSCWTCPEDQQSLGCRTEVWGDGCLCNGPQ